MTAANSAPSSDRPGCFSFRTLRNIFMQPEAGPRAAALAGADAFTLNPSLLSAGNRTYYAVLRTVVPDSAVIFAEVSLASVFEAKKVKGWTAARNRVNQKAVDFVVCDRATLKPLCAIEVDDRTHGRQDRVTRDEFVDALFRFHDLPLIRVRGAMSYRPEDVRAQLASVPFS